MKAIVVKTGSKPPILEWKEVPDPTLQTGEVLVKIEATAINRADLMQARGLYAPPPGASDILGLEMAGEIVALGEGVIGWQIGDRVCALLPGGGYAELAVVPHQMLLPLPKDWTYAQGAALPEVWYTAFVNLFWEGNLQPGEIALIHAGGSGVGTAAVQLAVSAGATAFVTAGTEEKLDKCRHLGASLAINYKKEDFLPAILKATNGQGVDVIIDPVAADYLPRNLQVLKLFGRLISIGLLSGGKAEMDMTLLLRKRLKLIGSTLRSRPLKEKIEITNAFRARFWPLFLSGELQTVIDTTFPVAQAQAAHQYVKENRNIGKVILEIN